MQTYVNIVDLFKSFLTSVYFQNRLRYSRDRAFQRVEVFQFIFSIHSLGLDAFLADVYDRLDKERPVDPYALIIEAAVRAYVGTTSDFVTENADVVNSLMHCERAYV